MLSFFLATLPVALADLAALGNARLRALRIASFLTFAYLFFRQESETVPDR